MVSLVTIAASYHYGHSWYLFLIWRTMFTMETILAMDTTVIIVTVTIVLIRIRIKNYHLPFVNLLIC